MVGVARPEICPLTFAKGAPRYGGRHNSTTRAGGVAGGQFTVSERRACRVLNQPRTTQRRGCPADAGDAELCKAILARVKHYPKWGYRKMSGVLQHEGWAVNHKRVHRLWKRMGLCAERKEVRKRAAESGANACNIRRATHKNHVWTVDFIFGLTSDGRPLKWLSVTDEFTRESLALNVGRNFDHHQVFDVLLSLMRVRGKPGFLRSDNEGEFISRAVHDLLAQMGSDIIHIEPGSPWQNGFGESFHAQLRREPLNRELFESVQDARQATDRFRRIYNEIRPHGSLKYLTPAAYSASLLAMGTSPAETDNPGGQSAWKNMRPQLKKWPGHFYLTKIHAIVTARKL